MSKITADDIRQAVAARTKKRSTGEISRIDIQVIVEEECVEFFADAQNYGTTRWNVSGRLAEFITEFKEYDNDVRFEDITTLTPKNRSAEIILEVLREKGIGIAIYNHYDVNYIELILFV